MALHVLRCGYAKGALRPGGLIVEATSGNTGISFAALGRALGHPVAIFMPDWLSPERIDLINSIGAEVRLVSKEEGGFLGSIRLAEELAARTPGEFLPRQFSNQDNCAAHETSTGPEIWSQLLELGLEPDGFVAGVGTGGTVMGTGRFLRRMKGSVSSSLWSRPIHRRSPPAARWGGTGSRESPTSSSPRSSTWPSSTR